jgi:LuxR family maltose regulon positive regulatory protein
VAALPVAALPAVRVHEAPPRPRGLGFARTKIQPPRPRPGALVERPAIEARLADALLHQRLVLVSAAAGYGKTTALSRQIGQLPAGTALAWVAADEGDDLRRLLDCLIAALEPFDPPWRTAPEALVGQAADGRPGVRAQAAAELLNTLDACEVAHGLIVFDDLHRVSDAPFFEFLDRLLERLSARWTLAIATRHDPPLALARLRARGELTEFRQADLRFDRAEVLALAASLGAEDDLSDQADKLLARTEGWAAGLRLGLSRGAGRAPVASDRAMFDFLTTEVIDQLDPELRGFLLQTAVLPELTAARAAAVSGNPRAALLMDQVERLGLFATPLDAAEPTLKLHDLFREALLQRLQREHPDDGARLWQRAAAGEGDPARQIVMLLKSGDLDAAAEALHGLAPALLTDGALACVARLVEQFPAPFTAASPPMQTVLGLLQWAHWDFAAMAGTMGRAEVGFAERGQNDRAQAAAAYRSLALTALGRHTESAARLAALRSDRGPLETRLAVLMARLWHTLETGQHAHTGALLDNLLDQLEQTFDASLWYRCLPVASMNGLPGTAGALQRFVTGALRVAGDRPLPLRAMTQVQAGWHHAWHDGNLDAAEAALATAQDDSRWLGDPANVKGTTQLLATFVHTMRGNRPRALAAAQALVDGHAAGRGASSLCASLHSAARVAAVFGDAETLQRHLARLEQAAAAHQGSGHARLVEPLREPLLEPLRGHRAALAGDTAAARVHWQNALADEAALDHLGHGIETRLFLAAGLHDAGRTRNAAAALAPVFERVAQGAGIGGVLMARPALRRLAAADWQGALEPAAVLQLRRWQALAQGDGTGGGRAEAAPAASPIGGLSARELEVLERIAAGESNKLIARAFDLSPHTVKRHVANILDKLGAESRGQAAAWHLAQFRP